MASWDPHAAPLWGGGEHAANHVAPPPSASRGSPGGVRGPTSGSVDNLARLLDTFVEFSADRLGPEDEAIVTAATRVRSLLEADYETASLSNEDGELCGTYPHEIFILESEKGAPGTVNSLERLEPFFDAAHQSRVRGRFVVPVILFHGRNVCRAATLSNQAEVIIKSSWDATKRVLRMATDPFTNTASESGSDLGSVGTRSGQTTPVSSPWLGYATGSSGTEDDIMFPQVEPCDHGGVFLGDGYGAADEPASNLADASLVEQRRQADISLLRALRVTHIWDLMVEDKKVKYGLKVCSSEKVDARNRYASFTLMQVPYPGCEFFRDVRDNNFQARGLVFDWAHDEVTAELALPDLAALAASGGDFCRWEDYQTWDLIQLTQNYLRLMIRSLEDDAPGTGTLIHCISGWDRTPMFVSLLRISLWADGAIHQSLDAAEILYLTLAYDWMLFSHRLSDRSVKGEDILYFCFYFLKHISGDAFAVASAPYDPAPPDPVIAVPAQRVVTAAPRGGGSGGGFSAFSELIRNSPSPTDALDPPPHVDAAAGETAPCPVDERERALAAAMADAVSNSIVDTSVHRSGKGIEIQTTPGSSRHRRLDSDASDSSNVAGSWQMVDVSFSPSFSPPDLSRPGEAAPSERRVRIAAVRRLFLEAYSKSLLFEAPQNTGPNSWAAWLVSYWQ